MSANSIDKANVGNKSKIKFRRILGALKRQSLFSYHSLLKTQKINLRGIDLQLGEHVSQPVQKAIYRGDYEEGEYQLVQSKLEASDIVMELGTGLGFISSYCAKRIGGDRVFTYEGNPSLEPYIRDLYRLNDVYPNLEICLLGRKEGEQSFYISQDFWISSTIKHDNQAKEIKVSVKEFNREIRRINPTFLIVDIEGGEYEWIQYADLFNVRKIAIEIHSLYLGFDKANFVKSELIKNGFQINESLSRNQEYFLERL